MITNLAGYTLSRFAFPVSHRHVPAQAQIVPALGEPIQPNHLETGRDPAETRLSATPRKPDGGFGAVPRAAADDADWMAFGFFLDAPTGQAGSPTPSPEIDHDPSGGQARICDDDTALRAKDRDTLPGKRRGKPLAEITGPADNRYLLRNTEHSGIGAEPVHIDRETS